MKLTLDYEVALTVRVDTETGEVEGVWVHTADFNGSMPVQVFNGGDNDLPEYLPLDHPEAVKAMEIGDQVEVTRWKNYSNGSGVNDDIEAAAFTLRDR